MTWARRGGAGGGALLSLCAFLAPDIPRGLLREQPQLLPEELAQAVGDPLVYNRMLAVLGRYSLATVTADDDWGASAGPGGHPGPSWGGE